MIAVPSRFKALCVAALALWACGEDDPQVRDNEVQDSPISGNACSPAPSFEENLAACIPLASDYQPRTNASATDTWASCISDDNLYHQVEPSISSVARVEAYEAVGAILWGGSAPTHEEFIAARIVFEQEQGLGSRVARRYDVHYSAPANGTCDDPAVAAANREHCVGPALLQPLIVAAFADGGLGNDRIVNAAKIEAAIQWFMYVSAIKEGTTCTDKPKDCDSAWAYYSGGTPRAAPIGLAADINAWSPATHDRAYDGVLALRCWRDLDPAVPAGDLAMRDQAIAQFDHALLRGMAILIRQRFVTLGCASGDYQLGALEALRILVPLFDRAARAHDAAFADLLIAEVVKDADSIDVSVLVAALDQTFDCP